MKWKAECYLLAHIYTPPLCIANSAMISCQRLKGNLWKQRCPVAFKARYRTCCILFVLSVQKQKVIIMFPQMSFKERIVHADDGKSSSHACGSVNVYKGPWWRRCSVNRKNQPTIELKFTMKTAYVYSQDVSYLKGISWHRSWLMLMLCNFSLHHIKAESINWQLIPRSSRLHWT